MNVTDLQESEFNFFYATYLNTLNNEEELLPALAKGRDWFVSFVQKLTKEQLAFSYESNKWTIAEVLVHIIDTERIFQYRAFRISRNDKTPLPGFEQDDYVVGADCKNRTKEDIIEEYLSVRDASIELFKRMTGEQLKRFGTASGMPWSVGAIGLVISGHQKHHQNILMERYFNN